MQKRISRAPYAIYHSPYGETTYKPAFTIIELLVVIVIIGILSTITFVTYNGIQDRAVATSLQSDLTNASDQLVIDQAHSNTGVFPATMAAANSGAGISTLFSTGTTPTYNVNNTNTPKTFCLTATKSNQSYFITQEGLPMPGPCPILYLDASIPTSYPESGTTWYDLSGHGNNGTLSATGVSYSSENGGVLTFDGISGYVDVADSALFNIKPLTVCVWARPAFFSNYQSILAKQRGGDAFEQFGLLVDSTGNVAFQSGASGTSLKGPLSLNTWAHICGSSNGTTVTIYINGQALGTGGDDSTYGATKPFRIGNTQWGARYFNGQINSIFVYNRDLTSTEITQNYNALKSRFGL